MPHLHPRLAKGSFVPDPSSARLTPKYTLSLIRVTIFSTHFHAVSTTTIVSVEVFSRWDVKAEPL